MGVAQGEYPWYALISSVKETDGDSITEEDMFLCAGTLINSKWVVTSATCLHEWQSDGSAGTERTSSDLKVRLGEHTISSSSISSYADEYSVDKIVVHEDFKSDVVGSLTIGETKSFFKSDIALVRLD